MDLQKKIKILLILFLLFDLSISFNQYYNTPIDGDVTSIVLPALKYKPVLNDPCGLTAITTNKDHSESNRALSIATTLAFFRTMPFIAQKWMSPISSIYFSIALLKLLIHIFIIIMLSAFITGSINFRNDKFILTSTLFTVFFQVGGYRSTMGIIDTSITYTISYALPIAFTLLLFYPLVLKYLHKKEINFNPFTTIIFILLALIVPFFGNQIPFVLFTILILNVISRISSNTPVNGLINYISNKRYKIFLMMFVVLCLYSFFLSLYNSERNVLDLSVVDRYLKLPLGIKNIFFGKPGLWILALLITVNCLILKIYNTDKKSLFFRTLKWSVLFIFIYVLLQPMDGYYNFRENIIRRDNFLPCILIMMFLFVQSSIYILEHFSNNLRARKIAATYLLAVICLFSIADSPSLRIDNCERASLELLSISEDKIVRLSDQCTIASWYIIYDSKDSEVNAEVFEYWKITKGKKLYNQN